MASLKVLAWLSLGFVSVVLLSILANPQAANPLDWLWPPTFYARVKEIITRPNYVPKRDVNPVLGIKMG
jgi:hypothetical protein